MLNIDVVGKYTIKEYLTGQVSLDGSNLHCSGVDLKVNGVLTPNMVMEAQTTYVIEAITYKVRTDAAIHQFSALETHKRLPEACRLSGSPYEVAGAAYVWNTSGMTPEDLCTAKHVLTDQFIQVDERTYVSHIHRILIEKKRDNPPINWG